MNYIQCFARLKVATADCSPDLKAFVNQIADAPVWNDDAARTIIADWTERIDAMLEDGGEVSRVASDLEIMQLQCLAELRNENIQRI